MDAKHYLICAECRCGLTLLRSILKQCKVGNPIEFDDSRSMDEISDEATAHGICGMSIGFRDLIKIRKKIFMEKVDDFEMLMSLFPNASFIRLYRRCKVKQAISWIKAARTQQFSQFTNQNEKVDVGDYSEEEIKRFILELSIMESRWAGFFNKNNITPYFISYEELCENMVTAIAGVLDFLRIEFSSISALEEIIREAKLPLRQYDATNENWYQQFMEKDHTIINMF